MPQLSRFIKSCQPLHGPPSSHPAPNWVHEIKQDGYRLNVRRDGSRVRCFTRNGHDRLITPPNFGMSN